MAEQFDEFVQELERDIRQEKFLKIWNMHGKKIIYGVAVLLIAIASYIIWQNYDSGRRTRLSQKFTGAQELVINGKTDQAIDVLRELTTSGSTYQSLSKFLLAALLREPGAKQDLPGALQLYEALSTDAQLTPSQRDFARLMAVSLRMANQESPDELLEKLKPLLAEKNPWHLQAMELQGVLLSQKGENMQDAEVFAKITRDSHVSQALLTRSQVMAQVLLQDAPASAEKPQQDKPLAKELAKQ
ncbi:MAG: tetratricopeptide repeat protein [Alphaproteobacteria bacterium]